MYRESHGKMFLEFLLFALITSTIAHVLFSWMGYNPTDDGFTLAYSRRIIEGQVPHRDFIIIRPFLSPLIHTPIVLLGGEYTFWFSRFFVWFQFTCIAWIWTSIINRYLGKPFSTIEQTFVALITFVLSVNVFPIMAWHTIDGLFLSSIGLALCLSKNQKGILAGYILIATAYLCKQNFILMAPGVMFILVDWRKTKYWIAITLPGIAYVVFLYVTGALSDAILQLGSQHDFLSVGVIRYIRVWITLLGVIAGYFLMRLSGGYSPLKTLLDQKHQKKLAIVLLFLVSTIVPLIGLVYTGNLRLYVTSFALFGIVIGVALYFALEKGTEYANRKKLQIALLVLLTAWSVSISLGYNSPVLASGLLVSLLITYTFTLSLATQKLVRFSLILLSVMLITSAFIKARHSTIYRDQSASNLTYPLDKVFPGGSGIRTNPNTYEYLADLQRAIHIAENNGSNYAIIPANAGYWVKSRQVNPLPIDWVQKYELNNYLLVDRVTASLESQRGNLIIITQKVRAGKLAGGFRTIPKSNHHAVVLYVHSHFTKFGETKCFELYK